MLFIEPPLVFTIRQRFWPVSDLSLENSDIGFRKLIGQYFIFGGQAGFFPRLSFFSYTVE